MPTIHRGAEGVWLEGVFGFNPGQFASSVHGAQARLCEAVGDPTTYTQLVAYSGVAFRVCVHEQMCPSAGHPCCGYMCVDNSNRALPWRGRLFECFPWAPPADRPALEAAACLAIKESIDRGLPVHYGGEEDGLIIGYADEGRRWRCVHPYHEGGRPFWHDEVKGFAGGQWPWLISVWTEPKPETERTPPRELALAALRQAVEMWRAGRCEAYFVGDAAYEHWLGWLRAVEAGESEAPRGGVQGNGWCLDTLLHYRRIAAAWLTDIAADFSPASDALKRAAEHYDRLVRETLAGFGCPWELACGAGRPDGWTSALRQQQLARLATAREHDRAAIEAIEEALEALG